MEIQQSLPASTTAPPAERARAVPLTPRTRNALGVAAAALALGALGDALLRPAPWGLNAALWTAALVAAAAGLQGWAGTEDRVRGWMPVALVIAALLAWRDSPTLKALDLAAMILVLGLAVHRARGGTIRLGGLAAYAGGVLASFLEAAFGAVPLLAKDVGWGEMRRDGWSRHLMAAGRGVALALPLLLVFGALLTAADAAFERLLSSTFAFDAPLAVSHVLLALVFAWLAAGVLRALVLSGEPVGGRIDAAGSKPSLGIVELGVVLGLLDALFLAFVAVQASYFFGGSAMVEAPGTTTYAEYARRGFFELCEVAGLVLPMLLGAHWLVRKEEGRSETVFRVLAGTMVALVFVMMASALHRMRLYQAAYGLTELRLYTTAFMLWLAVVFAWFAWTVLRGRRERFAFGAFAAALEGLVVLHAVNPDALIVRVNATRDSEVVRFDARYAAGLSADAVPALLAAMPEMAEEDRCLAAARLLRRWDGEGEDWRSWSLGRGRALRAVDAREAELERLQCAPPATATIEPGRMGVIVTDTAMAPATPPSAPAASAPVTTAPAAETVSAPAPTSTETPR